jgi:predicted dehydrogenase
MAERMRGAVVGFGFICGKGHVPAYLERKDVEITAIADVSPGRRTLAKEVLPRARIYEDYESLLRGEEGKLDFLDVSTPPCDHARIATAGLEAGLHVLCEKPLTTTLAEARALLEVATKRQRVLFPCHNYKHAPVVRAIKEVLASGQIGKVRSINLNTFRNTHARGVPEWKTHWRRQKAYSGGGIAMDHGSHTFYLAFDWMGSYPTAVTAKISNLEPGRWDTEDNFSAVLTFPNGLAHAHLTWTAGVRKVIYAVQGEKGAITVDDDALELALMERTDGPDVAQGAVRWNTQKRQIASQWMDASHVSWFNAMFDRFKSAIEHEQWVSRDAAESYLCIQLIEGAYRSAKEKCVEVPLSTEVPGYAFASSRT